MSHDWPYGVLGDANAGEIELAPDGLEDPARWFFQSPYLRARNDPLTFPGGTKGHYLSHAPHMTRVAGAAILPVFEERILSLQQFRHAPRRWGWEAPRGYSEPGESPEEAARRELAEETG
jgi:ADP-ribose pyrophosphatase